jgi:UDP-glucuronate 4-epimerase
MAAYLFADAINRGKAIDVYNYGKMRRDFTYIDDIVSGIMAAFTKEIPQGYQIFNLGNNKSVELLYFIELIESFMNKKSEKNLMPLQPGDVPETYADIEKARRILGFSPVTSIEKGLESFIKWFKEYNN